MSETETSPEIPAAESVEAEIAIPPQNDRDDESDRIVRNHVLWSICAGTVPVPLFDVAAVTAVQMDALKKLAMLYEVDYSESTGKSFVTALAGGTFARIGASAIKVLPGVGSIIGGLSMMALSGASTYAVCHVAINHFKEHGDFLDLDLDMAKEAYRDALKKGKEMVKKFEGKEKEARENHRLLKELENLRKAGVLSEEEFEAKKADVLKRM